MAKKTVMFLPGDGIGPEVAAEAGKALHAAAERFGLELQVSYGRIGGISYEEEGTPLTEETLRLCKAADAVFLGAVGGPRWERIPVDKRPEAGLLRLRSGLEVFANLRPAAVYPELAAFSRVRPDLVCEGIDLLVVRELTGDIYFGQPRGRGERNGIPYAYDTMLYDEAEVRRIAHVAFRAAQQRRKKLCSVDKANVLETSRLWRAVVEEVAASYADVAVEHMYVDKAAMQLVAHPANFDVVLTGNLFGDILSDLAASVVGSLGMLPSASLGDKGPGVYEPIHGSAPDLAGQNKANPLAAILSVAMMLRMSLAAPEAADAVEQAVRQALRDGRRSADLLLPGDGSPALSCSALGDCVARYIENPPCAQ